MKPMLRPRIVRLLLAVGVACGALLPVSAARYGAKADPSAVLFTNSIVRHVRIEIGDDEIDILRKPVARSRTVGTRPSVMATVREGNLVWTNVSVHLKGSFGSFRPVDDRPALTLNFDKHMKEQRFHGLEKISLNNSVQDPSYVNEKITREIYAAAGVPVPRTDYATVELNGRPLGLYVLAEGWNKQFFKRHFANAKGNYYDGSHDVHQPKEAEFGNDPTNHAALNAVKAILNERDHARRVERLRATVDLDRFISLHALDVLMWNWDGYGLNRNNYRMFHDLDTDRIVFIPHGVDQMFWKANGPIVTGRSGLVAKSLLETPQGRELYLERFRKLRTEMLDVRAITNRIAELTARLQPVLMKRGLGAAMQQRAAAQQFAGLVMARVRNVDAQLASVKQFTPIKLQAAAPLTNWMKFSELGEVSFATTTNEPEALRVSVRDTPSLGVWTTTLWLEEGRYRIEGRVKTLGVESDGRVDAGAGFRVWSTRKETRGASWSWFPYATGRDTRMGGLIPAATNAPQQRLSGDHNWQLVTHEFELRQPLADVQIQCALQASSGAAWFDLSSLKIRRTALTVRSTTAKE
jgi:spore coat protein H